MLQRSLTKYVGIKLAEKRMGRDILSQAPPHRMGIDVDSIIYSGERRLECGGIGLRLLVLGAGGVAAHVEADRMVAEKASAFAAAATTLATGGNVARRGCGLS